MHCSPTIVLTFDDAVSNHATFVAPLLRERGFGATFYVTEFAGEGADNFATDKRQYMTWQQIRELHDAGFEIGNHTAYHRLMTGQQETEMRADVAYIDARCAEHGLPPPQTFAYPASRVNDTALRVVRERGFRWARISGDRMFRPGADDPLHVPGFVITEEKAGLLQHVLDTGCEEQGVIVLIYHGVPDYNHPWVDTRPETFRRHMDLLRERNCHVVALRDIP